MTQSDEAAQDGDAVGNGELALLDALVLGEPMIVVPDGDGESAVEVGEQHLRGAVPPCRPRACYRTLWYRRRR
jgi:hypothetical protein